MNSINSIASSPVNIISIADTNYQLGNADNKQSFQNILDVSKNTIETKTNENSYTENSIDKNDTNEYSNKPDDIGEDKVSNENNDIDKEINKSNNKDDTKDIRETQIAENDSINTDENKDSDIDTKEKLKNIKELIAKLETTPETDVDVKLNTINELKKSILSIEEDIDISSKDKDEMKSILASLSILSKNIDDATNIKVKSSITEDIKIESKTKNIENFAKEDIKNIKDRLDKLVENIESKTIVAKDDTDIESSLASIDNNTNNLLDNIKDIKTEKTKVSSDGRVDAASNNSSSNSNETSEITVVRMKDSVDDVSQRLNNADGNIKTNNTNKTDTLDSAKNFQDMMSKLVDKAKIAVSEGKSEVVMTLKPERLGDVRLKIQIEGEEVNAKIFVDNAEIKDLFTKNLDTVIKSLGELNINVGGFDVLLRDDMSGDDFSEFKELLENGNNKNNFQKQSELESNIKTIEKYSLPERRLNLVI